MRKRRMKGYEGGKEMKDFVAPEGREMKPKTQEVTFDSIPPSDSSVNNNNNNNNMV